MSTRSPRRARCHASTAAVVLRPTPPFTENRAMRLAPCPPPGVADRPPAAAGDQPVGPVHALETADPTRRVVERFQQRVAREQHAVVGAVASRPQLVVQTRGEAVERRSRAFVALERVRRREANPAEQVSYDVERTRHIHHRIRRVQHCLDAPARFVERNEIVGHIGIPPRRARNTISRTASAASRWRSLRIPRRNSDDSHSGRGATSRRTARPAGKSLTNCAARRASAKSLNIGHRCWT